MLEDLGMNDKMTIDDLVKKKINLIGLDDHSGVVITLKKEDSSEFIK